MGQIPMARWNTVYTESCVMYKRLEARKLVKQEKECKRLLCVCQRWKRPTIDTAIYMYLLVNEIMKTRCNLLQFSGVTCLSDVVYVAVPHRLSRLYRFYLQISIVCTIASLLPHAYFLCSNLLYYFVLISSGSKN